MPASDLFGVEFSAIGSGILYDGMTMSDNLENNPETWVDRHGDALYRYAMLRVRSPEAVADIVQETFLHALRSREGFAGRSTERTWLIGILRHKILDHYRRTAVAGATEIAIAASVDDSGIGYDARGHWQNAPKSWGNDPSQSLESKEFWGVFHQCLGKLPRSLADAFFLREVDGLDSIEVQRELGVSPANLWTRLHRARSLLRGCLERNWFDSSAPRSDPPEDINDSTPTPASASATKGGSML